MRPTSFTYRVAGDADLVLAMLRHAANWDPTRPAFTPEQVAANAQLSHYAEGLAAAGRPRRGRRGRPRHGEKAKPAIRLYQRLGLETVRDDGDAVTMLRRRVAHSVANKA